MSTHPVSDHAVREHALDPTRSFIVQAPAGSGKTALLIQRYLVLLATVAAPEEIVAITFTKKAAGEMRKRVLEVLRAARERKAPETEHAARTLELARLAVAQDERRGWRVAEDPARLRIQTIDALCVALTRQMPISSRFGAQPESVEDAAELYREAARATVALVQSRADVAAEMARLLEHLDNDVARVEALFAGMLERRDQWVRRLRRPDRATLEAALEHERERIAARARAVYPGAAPADPAAWQGLARDLLTQAGEWRKRSPAAQALGARPEGEALRRTLEALVDMPPAAYSDAQWQALEAIGNLLPHAIAQLQGVFQARGQVDFVEVARAALRALGEEDAPSDLALALDYRIRHLLVDEFQDTSVTQYELTARLTAGWEPGDGRTLFAVGDPMQSIYRFREAEVGEFLRTWASRKIGSIDVEPVRLSANFRSQAGIVEWVNAAFRGVMPEREDIIAGAVPYADSVPVHQALRGDAVAVHPFFDKDEEGEASKVVEVIARVRQDEPGATVAILVRSRAHLRRIVPRLRAAGVRFRAIEIDSLGDRPVVQDLLALTRALAHAADRVAWLAVLRAPWCGLALADLAALAEGDHARTPWELMGDGERVGGLSTDGRARLVRAREVLAPFVAAQRRGGLRDQVEGAWLALGGPAVVQDETDLEDAETYLDALEGAEDAGALRDLPAFEQRLEKLWALPDTRAGDRDVQIMTIHKAKGLEFDHVIVPGLGRGLGTDDQRLFLWTERPAAAGEAGTELLVAPIEALGSDDDAIYQWLKTLEAEREGHEAARLLYVAATRARGRLHLLGDTRREGGAEPPRPRAPNSATLLAKLWPVVEDRFRAAAAAVPGPAAKQGPAPGRPDAREPDSTNQDLRRLAADWRLAAPPAAVSWQPPADEAPVPERIEFSWVGETARHVGSVVHRWLQRIGDAALAGWDRARIDGVRPHVRHALRARGVREADLDAAAERVLVALHRAITDQRGRWVLGPHPQAVTEHRVTALVEGTVRRLVIDRMFEDEAGERWIVDYKTSSHEGAEVEAFLDRERERYAAQLARYARAVGGVDRLGLYFPLLGGWRED